MRSNFAINWQIIGPITLLASYPLASFVPFSIFPLDLFFSGAIGLYFCARWCLKGCSYALILLVITGIIGHIFLEAHHFLRLGLEASFACSFFITALAFESESENLTHLESQLSSRDSVIQNLEEEISKSREAAVQAQIASAQKIGELQKNYDDLSMEKSTLEILNDVLRKANAAHFEEKIALETQIQEEQRTFEKKLLEQQNIGLQEASQKVEKLLKERSALAERLATAEQKVNELAQFDFLYKQLRTQFEEKNRVLHEARSRLFKAETELQTIAREREQQQESFLPETLRAELDRWDEEIGKLQEENGQLQDLVTHLTSQLPQPLHFTMNRTPLPSGKSSLEETLREALTPKRKKKATKKTTQQDLLFNS